MHVGQEEKWVTEQYENQQEDNSREQWERDGGKEGERGRKGLTERDKSFLLLSE